MPDKKKSLSPITVLMIFTVMAAMATWIMPAGRYDKLSNKDNDHFILSTEKGNLNLPFAQKTLDSLHILIGLEKFRMGSIQKPVSVPGSYHRVAQNKEGPLGILQARSKVCMRPLISFCSSCSWVPLFMFSRNRAHWLPVCVFFRTG
jgi:uncharacterized ion transporter superfamily protein YfcC